MNYIDTPVEQPTVASLQEDIRWLNTLLNQHKQNTYSIEHIENYIKENYRTDHSHHLDEIASIIGLELEQEYVIDVTIRGSLRITLPMDVDPDDIIPQIDVDLSITDHDFQFYHEDIDFDIMEGEY